MPKKPVKGFRSSLVASTLALLMLMAVLLISNSIQKSREGEGKYAFDEELCYDIDNVKQFDNAFTKAPPGHSGTGALAYRYWDDGGSIQHTHRSKVSILDLPKNETLNEFAIANAIPDVGDLPVVEPAPFFYRIDFNMNFTKKAILDLDITRMDIYIEIQGVTFQTVKLLLFTPTKSIQNFQKTINLGNLTGVSITVMDLLNINTASTTDKLIFGFQTQPGEFIPGNSNIIFDMQWYCIKEIKIPTLTKLGLWLGAGGIFYIFLGLVVSPEYTIEGIIDKMVKLSKGGK